MSKSNSPELTQQTLFDMENYESNKNENEVPKADVPLKLTLTSVDRNESKNKQFTYLIECMGVKLAHKLCEKYNIYAIKKDDLFLVSTFVDEKHKKNFRKIELNGVTYYIYVGTSNDDKQKHLNRLSQAMLQEYNNANHQPPIENIDDSNSSDGEKLIIVEPTLDTDNSSKNNTHIPIKVIIDGKQIIGETSKDIFVNAIKYFGLETVDNLVSNKSKVDKTSKVIVDKTLEGHSKTAKDRCEEVNGWYVFTCMNDDIKKEKLKNIARELNCKIEFL